jgi:hypothetical protein
MAQAKPYHLKGAPVYTTKAIIVLGPYTKAWIPVKVKATLQEDHDFIFELTDYMAGNTEDGGDFTIHAHLGLSTRTATRSGPPHRTAAVWCGLGKLQSARAAGSNSRTRAGLRATMRVLLAGL